MIRVLQYVNFLGIVALCVLCALQWQNNRRLNLNINDLEKTRLEQLDTIAQRDGTIRGLTADLEEFRARLTTAQGQIKDLKAELKDVQTNLDTTTAQRDALEKVKTQLLDQLAKLRTSLEEWKAAVAIRDTALKESHDVVDRLTADRNAAVLKFNGLAEKYNKLVADLNARAGATTGPTSQPATSPQR